MAILSLPLATRRLLTAQQALSSVDSVVKELVENALDAQATSIEVRLADRGLTLISVKDNGSGISPQDLALFAKPHHTSKITSDDALRSVKSFGFRGEAVHSIVSHARSVTVTSRTVDDPIAQVIEFDSSASQISVKSTAAPVGTSIVISNLFHPFPVRRQHAANSSASVFKKCVSVLSAYAVIRPDVRFSFHAKDAKKVESGTWERPVVKATPDIGKNVLQSICLVYGNDVASKIQFKSLDINVDYEDDDENGGLTRGKATVHAWIPIGTSAHPNTNHHFYLNSRPILPRTEPFKSIFAHLKSLVTAEKVFCVFDLVVESRFDVNLEPGKDRALIEKWDVIADQTKEFLNHVYVPVILKEPVVAARANISLMVDVESETTDGDSAVAKSISTPTPSRVVMGVVNGNFVPLNINKSPAIIRGSPLSILGTPPQPHQHHQSQNSQDPNDLMSTLQSDVRAPTSPLEHVSSLSRRGAQTPQPLPHSKSQQPPQPASQSWKDIFGNCRQSTPTISIRPFNSQDHDDLLVLSGPLTRKSPSRPAKLLYSRTGNSIGSASRSTHLSRSNNRSPTTQKSILQFVQHSSPTKAPIRSQNRLRQPENYAVQLTHVSYSLNTDLSIVSDGFQTWASGGLASTDFDSEFPSSSPLFHVTGPVQASNSNDDDSNELWIVAAGPTLFAVNLLRLYELYFHKNLVSVYVLPSRKLDSPRTLGPETVGGMQVLDMLLKMAVDGRGKVIRGKDGTIERRVKDKRIDGNGWEVWIVHDATNNDKTLKISHETSACALTDRDLCNLLTALHQNRSLNLAALRPLSVLSLFKTSAVDLAREKVEKIRTTAANTCPKDEIQRVFAKVVGAGVDKGSEAPQEWLTASGSVAIVKI